MMTREIHIAKAENIIFAALRKIEQDAESAAYMSGHAERFASCYTMQEIDAVQKKCDADRLKANCLSALYHGMNQNRESVKVLDFASLWLWYPKQKAAAIRHMTAYAKRTGEMLDFFALYDWIYDRIPATFWTVSHDIRRDYKTAFVTLTAKTA